MTDRAYNAQKKRIVCWFSCGAASAVATKLALGQFANQEVVIARCIVREEHPDNDRFAADCEKWFGVQITNLINEKYDGSISAEHGVGMTKKPYLNYTRSEEEIGYMKALKQVFDPNGIMNPGKLFDL